jgi:hypothetical protein
MTTATKNEKAAKLAEMGWALAVLSGPEGETENFPELGNFTSIRFLVRVLRNGKTVGDFPYSMGTGFVDLKLPVFSRQNFEKAPKNFEHFLHTAKRNPSARFIDTEGARAFWEHAAKIAKLRPDLADVLGCLLLDGECYRNAESFDEFCSNFGYDNDSRNAERIYNECMETGRKFARFVSSSEVEEIRELLDG